MLIAGSRTVGKIRQKSKRILYSPIKFSADLWIGRQSSSRWTSVDMLAKRDPRWTLLDREQENIRSLFRFPTRARRPDYLAHNVHPNDTGDRDLLESREVSTGWHDSSVQGRADERPRANLYPDTERAERYQEDRIASYVRSHVESHVRSTMPTYVCAVSRCYANSLNRLSSMYARMIADIPYSDPAIITNDSPVHLCYVRFLLKEELKSRIFLKFATLLADEDLVLLLLSSICLACSLLSFL